MNDPSLPLKNSRHEAFALAWAEGKSLGEAYMAAGYAAKDPHSKGSRMAENGSILARKRWIQAQAATGTILTIAEKREFIARLVRCKLDSLPADSDLWQEIKYTEHGVSRKLPDKLRAIAVDNDLAGEGSNANMADAVTDSVSAMMARIRSKR